MANFEWAANDDQLADCSPSKAQVEVDVEHLVDTVRHNFTPDKRQGSWGSWRKVQ